MMKTAKETLKDKYEQAIKENKGRRFLKWEFVLTEPLTKYLFEAMEDYAAAACKEQREICADQYWDEPEANTKAGVYNEILNAPQPQLL